MGKYSDEGEAQTAENVCKACVVGKYSDEGEAQTAENVCKACAAGKYSDAGVAQITENVCESCPSGYYQNFLACDICPSGWYQSKSGQDTCVVERQMCSDDLSGGTCDAPAVKNISGVCAGDVCGVHDFGNDTTPCCSIANDVAPSSAQVELSPSSSAYSPSSAQVELSPSSSAQLELSPSSSAYSKEAFDYLSDAESAVPTLCSLIITLLSFILLCRI